jgi:carboxyl-terminal processing protease
VPVPQDTRLDRQTAAEVRLTVLRPGTDRPLEVSVAPAVFRPESVFGARRRPDGTWDFMLDPADRLGYVRLGAIGVKGHVEFHAALNSLDAQSVRGLVLDLRWCPIGFLRPSAAIARMLLPPYAVIASQRGRKPGDSGPVEAAVDVTGNYTEFPVVVLVNGETSGAGELIAAALQDHLRAAVAGQRTVGKASIQKPLDQEYGLPFKLTTGTFHRHSGRNLQRFPDSTPADDWGVRPDPGRELPMSPELSRRLKEWYELHTLRPAGSREALPLDDPEADPQRLAAVQMLRDLVKEK